MRNPTDWAWDVPLARPDDPAATTRVVLLALAALSAPTLPGVTTLRLGIVDPTHPAIALMTGLTPEQVQRHVAALIRADVLIPAPEPHRLVRLNEAITSASGRVAQTVADTLAVLPEQVPDNVIALPAAAEQAAEQAPLIEVPAQAAPARRATKPRAAAAALQAPEEAAAKAVLAWWWEHWTSHVGPVANGAAFSAHCKRIVKTMLAEGHDVEAIKSAFVAVDQPRPTEWAVRNHLRGKTSRAAGQGSAANLGAALPRAGVDPFAAVGGDL